MLTDIHSLHDHNCCGSDLFLRGRDGLGYHRDLWDKSEREPAVVSEDTHYPCSETVNVEFERMRKSDQEPRFSGSSFGFRPERHACCHR